MNRRTHVVLSDQLVKEIDTLDQNIGLGMYLLILEKEKNHSWPLKWGNGHEWHLDGEQDMSS